MSENQTEKVVKKTGLGRGLGSLLGAGMEESDDVGFQESPRGLVTSKDDKASEENLVKLVPIEQVHPNKAQPRKEFSPDELEELSKSISEKGVIQPILAQKLGPKEYQIIAGERRWRASAMAGLDKVPVIVRKKESDKEALELALIENIQRQDLNPMEEAEAYQLLSQKYQMTQQEIANRMGKDRVTITNIMRLMQLGREVRQMVKDGIIQIGQAKVLLSIQDLDIQNKMAKMTMKKGLSVRALESLVKKYKNGQTETDHLEQASESEDLAIQKLLLKDLEEELQKKLGTRVQIGFNGEKGRLAIDFYSIDELNDLVDKLRG